MALGKRVEAKQTLFEASFALWEDIPVKVTKTELVENAPNMFDWICTINFVHKDATGQWNVWQSELKPLTGKELTLLSVQRSVEDL